MVPCDCFPLFLHILLGLLVRLYTVPWFVVGERKAKQCWCCLPSCFQCQESSTVTLRTTSAAGRRRTTTSLTGHGSRDPPVPPTRDPAETTPLAVSQAPTSLLLLIFCCSSSASIDDALLSHHLTDLCHHTCLLTNTGSFGGRGGRLYAGSVSSPTLLASLPLYQHPGLPTDSFCMLAQSHLPHFQLSLPLYQHTGLPTLFLYADSVVSASPVAQASCPVGLTDRLLFICSGSSPTLSAVSASLPAWA